MSTNLDALAERFPRVAITHEWLTVSGGSEKVVLSLLELFPHAEIFTSVYDPEPWPGAITDRPVHVSFLDRIPGARKHYPKLLPLMNAAFESFDLRDFDLVISSNHSCAKNVLTGPSTLHVCYCHTPMRYAWEPRFLDDEPMGSLARALVPLLIGGIRRRDLIASSRPDLYVANSRHVAARIAKYYRREARVVHPPVDVGRFLEVRPRPSDYYLFFGRVVPYKRADVAVAACARLDRPLKVVGGGRGVQELAEIAGPTTEILGSISDRDLPSVLAGARALLFPGEEDFGIIPVEAQAAGLPVIAYGVGGVRDSVLHGETGLLYDDPSVDGLCGAIRTFEEEGPFDEAVIRANVSRFAPERFKEGIVAAVQEAAASRGLPLLGAC